MKRKALLGFMAAAAVCGCNVSEINDVVTEPKVFTAIIEDSAETKTSLDGDGNVLWKMGDQVSIFAGNTVNEQYQVTDASDGEMAASLYQVTSPGSVTGTDIDNNVAFYPYASAVTIAKSGNAYTLNEVTLPATQTYAEGSFGNGAFPMAAVTSSTSDNNLKFKNVLGGLKLQLTGTAVITSISVMGNNDEILCGAAEVTVSNTGVPTISLTDETAKTVTLDCGDGVQLDAETATAFIIALPAMTMEGGFTVTVADTDGGQMEIQTTKVQTITRSNLLKMPAVAYEGTPVTTHVAVDLGLTSGLKWASCNVGANAPEEYGDYFAWGETEPYYSSQDPLTWKEGKTAGYDWPSYKWCGGSARTQIKYCTDSWWGTVDNKTVLELEDDAAHVNWGGSWRMPTDAEWTELRTECTWTSITQSGVNGYLVTGPNDNSIFLPAANTVGDTDPGRVGNYGYYWSSSLYTNASHEAYYFLIRLNDLLYTNDEHLRCNGFSVRPVSE